MYVNASNYKIIFLKCSFNKMYTISPIYILYTKIRILNNNTSINKYVNK